MTQADSTPGPIRVLLVDDQELIRTGFALILSTAVSGVRRAGEPGGDEAELRGDEAELRGIDVVGEAGEGEAALAMIERLAAEGCAPHVVLMDVRMPGMNGIDATAAITERFADTRVLVLTTFDLDEYALAAIEAGASGFLLKDARAAELIGAVRAVASGDSVMAPSVTRRLITHLRGGSGVGSESAGAQGEHGETRAAGQPEASRETGASTETGATGPTRVSRVIVSSPGGNGPEPRHPASDAAETGSPRVTGLTEREQEVFELIAEGLSNGEIGARLFLSESTVKTHVGRVLSKLNLRDRVHAVILAYELGVR